MDERDAVRVAVRPQPASRNRLTIAIRPVLALPHALLVGAPLTLPAIVAMSGDRPAWATGGGALGALAGTAAFISWFAILFTGSMPRGLYDFAALYLRWRVRAVAYMTLLTDVYPPFGETSGYPVELRLPAAPVQRRRMSVAFRIVLAVPQIVVIALLGVVWLAAIVAAWLIGIVAGRVPNVFQWFGSGMLQWATRVEAYLLLLIDDYPAFGFDDMDGVASS